MDKTKILVVEDEIIVAMELKIYLETMGYHVVAIAATGEEAIEVALKENPDIILMDIMIKGNMDGIETAQKILSHQDTSIIYTTAYCDEEILKRAKLTEPVGYMLKPLNTGEVNANIQMAIHKKESDENNKKVITGVSAIIPAYNEQVSIGSIVLKTKTFVDRVIVVDDGSIDRTAEIALLAGAEVITHKINMGKGRALKTGFEAVKNSDIIITLDGDGQHSTRDISKLLEPILNGEADVVNGSRYLIGDEKNTPKYRRLGQNVLDRATNFNAKSNVTDSQSGFRAFSAQTFSTFKFRESGYSIESEMIAEASNAGFRIVEVPINVRYDVKGSKKHPVTHGVGVLVKVLRDIEFNRPLWYFTFPGVIMIAVGLISGLIFFGSYLNHESSSLAATTLAALLTLAGTFISFTGIILHSMSRMIERALSK